MTDASATPRPNLTPIIIAILLTCIFLAFLAYVNGTRRNRSETTPQLTIIQPIDDATVDSPLVIHFKSVPTIAPGPGGWGYERLHLHAWIDSVSYMPAAADITQADSGVFRWTIPVAARGQRTVQLGWGDTGHRELQHGRTQVVGVTIR